ncbi:MAG: DUF3291 domain-containing protein [Fluviicola sp.]
MKTRNFQFEAFVKVTITSIELKGPFKFFALSSQALKIIRQLRTTQCKDFKKRGFWTTHYTMTLWNNEEELKQFAKSGAHLEAMKASGAMAKEIRTITIEAETLPNWIEAKQLLKQGKVIAY